MLTVEEVAFQVQSDGSFYIGQLGFGLDLTPGLSEMSESEKGVEQLVNGVGRYR